MDRIRLDDVPGRVVAWHNRHPLAQRVAPADVHSIGEVVLPFAAAAGTPPLVEPPPTNGTAVAAAAGPLRGRVARAGMRRTLCALFSERFIDELSPRRVARWAIAHADASPLAPDDSPRRTIETDPALAERQRRGGRPGIVQLHLLTAAIRVGDRRLRVLLDGAGRVLGVRALARVRVAVACVACAGLGGFGALLLPLGAATLSPMPAVAATAPASVPSLPARPAAAASTAASGQVRVAAAASEPARVAATVPASPPPPAPPVTAPAPVAGSPPRQEAQARAAIAAVSAASRARPAATEPAPIDDRARQAAEPGAPSARLRSPLAPLAPRVSIRPALDDEERRLAREAGQKLREEARLGPRATAAAPVDPGRTARAAAAPRRPVYALVAPPTPQRDESLALLDRAQVLRAMNVAPARSEVFAAKGMWRAAFWPFETIAEAERARIVLAGKGLKAEVVEF